MEEPMWSVGQTYFKNKLKKKKQISLDLAVFNGDEGTSGGKKKEDYVSLNIKF